MLTLQGNPSGREADRPQVFQTAIANDFADVKHEVVTSTEKGHGRLDERACHVIEIPTATNLRSVPAALRRLARPALAGHRRLAPRSGR